MISRRGFLGAAASAAILTVAPTVRAKAASTGLANPFFAFKNSMEEAGPASVVDQVAILKDLGFDGFENRELVGLDGAVKALDGQKLKLFTSYFAVNIDPGETPYNEGLEAALPLLKNRGTVLWCNTHSKKFKPSDSTGDEIAVPLFRKLADLVAPYGVRLAPYPHIGLWVESPEDTARLADKVRRPNFGTSFNLHHWKALGERKQPLAEIVKRCASRMFVMSICGTKGPAGIGPLEAESIDEYFGVLKAFLDAGYTGPVGLQCYKILGDPKLHLSQSMSVWKSLKEKFASKSDAKA